MQPGLVFFHGWGLSPAFWRPLAARLGQYPQVFVDTGYFGPPHASPLPPGTAWVGIGHSLGFARALQSPPAQGWAALVSVAGFSRFCPPAVDRAAGGLASTHGVPLAAQPRRVVERMLRAYANDAPSVLADFLHRCGLRALAPAPHAPLQVDRLGADLALLLDVDVSVPLAAMDVPVLAMAARDDPIVGAAVTEAVFAPRSATQLVWHAHGGHALGYEAAAACASAVQSFLERL